MDKKITEMAGLQKAITSNTSDIKMLDNRMRILELEVVKHNAQSASAPKERQGSGTR